jgi:hypothetical protein
MLGRMRSMLVLCLCLGIFCSPARADDAGVAAASACPPATAETLFAAIPAAVRGGDALARSEDDERERLETTPRVVELELDGGPPREAVLGLETIATEEESHVALYVLACRAGAWTSLGRVELEIDEGWNGTIDERPGVAVLRPETVAGVAHDFLRIEVTDVRGSYDPRFVRRRFLLVHVVRGEVVTALDLVVREEVEGGPARDTIFTATRRIVLRAGTRGRPPRYRLTVSTEDLEAHRRRSCRTWLVFDGERFAPTDVACAAR